MICTSNEIHKKKINYMKFKKKTGSIGLFFFFNEKHIILQIFIKKKSHVSPNSCKVMILSQFLELSSSDYNSIFPIKQRNAKSRIKNIFNEIQHFNTNAKNSGIHFSDFI